MNKKIVYTSLILILLIIGYSGCTEKKISSNSNIPNEFSSDESKNQDQMSEPETIETILTKPDNFDSIYYEILMDMDISEFGQQNAFIKIWQKGSYVKEEISSASDDQSLSILLIQSPNGTYVYDDEQDKYILSLEEVSTITTSLQYVDSSMMLDYISNLTTTEFERDIIDGKETMIIEYSPEVMGNSLHVKIWIWIEKGLPLKGIIDIDVDAISMKMELNYSNYSFANIPDTVFDLD